MSIISNDSYSLTCVTSLAADFCEGSEKIKAEESFIRSTLDLDPKGCSGRSDSLELALDGEGHVVGRLQDLLQAHDVVGVGVAEGDVVGKATDFYGLGAAADQLVGDHHGAVQAQGLAWGGGRGAQSYSSNIEAVELN